ncbi:MAG: hypothetical protein IPP15_07755 [Saprospiraceae bacterium]|uniref:Doubled CXXCH motif domain-containing protein n=1 Tax=Candidatus Opimibacter skivensis TaxID=2982028 RepID=A0A9D7SS43_9BACT|nr:hypothetical protein [Candidatus Opimibacter skivensis]
MKNQMILICCLLGALILGLASCEGDQGPIGPVGPVGPNGPMGELGTQHCMECHGSSQLITAKMYQYEHSVHATGGNNNHNATNCAICHTSQGFLERIATGAVVTAAPINDPLPQNCYTCHQIHRTYSEADWGFTQTQPVTLWVGGQTLDFGKANLCISCHQSRTYTPALLNPSTASNSDTVNITNARYGPHHGPQGVMLPGLNGYEVAGPLPYENSAHTALLANNIKNACIVCHMGAAQAAESGGHTFRVISELDVINTAACVECHPVANDVKALVVDRQGQIDARLAELKALLVARGRLDPVTDLAKPGKFVGHEAGALFNYKFVSEDKSRGVHNFKYANALLVNSIAALQ